MRILLADDHSMFREGLKKLLETNADFEVVGEASDGRQAVEMAMQYSPDVVLMDVSMPGLNGVEATRKILIDQPQTKVVGLSMHTDRRYPSELLRAGAAGYLPKDGSFDELEHAVRAVYAGEVYLSPRLSAQNGDGNGESGVTSVFDRLTAREREVLQLMAEGQATKEIAATLHVSVKTVETHRRQIMEKLNIYSVAELTKYAIREGLTSIEN
jgi:two-component system response regulator NreC